MTVLVDTPIWSLALRRKRKSPTDLTKCDELARLIREARAELIGPVRQELLSGIRDQELFETVRMHMRGFDEIPVQTCDYEQAARLDNQCRRKGVQGSPIDFLLCAVSQHYEAPIFTTDHDFARYAKHINITLHVPG